MGASRGKLDHRIAHRYCIAKRHTGEKKERGEASEKGKGKSSKPVSRPPVETLSSA
jgi:hypothetical protein